MVVVSAIGLHAFHTYTVNVAADESKMRREIVEKRYVNFEKKITSDEWLRELEKKVKSKDQGEIRQYVKGALGEWGSESGTPIRSYNNII